MELSDIRQEIYAHGFGSNQYPPSRLNQFINEAYGLVCRRVGFYVNEATQAFSTVVGTATYAWPTDLGHMRSLFDTSRNVDLKAVVIDDIDRSTPSNGAPLYYAMSAANVLLYPTPDAVYPLEYRYYKQPAALVNDTDTPTLPSDYHSLLVYYGIKRCYMGDDDPQNAGYWDQQYETLLRQFTADVKFPDANTPHVVRGMWEQDAGLGKPGWSDWGYA